MKKQKKILTVFLSVFCIITGILSTTLTADAATYKLNKTSLNLNVGTIYTLSVNTKSRVTWTSGNKAIATVSSKGTITAQKTGSTYITARIGRTLLKCKVNIFSAKLNVTKKSIDIGSSYTLKVSGNAVSKWTSSNAKIASVTSKGKVTGKKAGKCTIYAYVGNSRIACTITVRKKAPPADTNRTASAQLIAHRGASDLAPENTIPAFKLAAQKGFRYIECDVRETKDGALVISHDASLLRACGIGAAISTLTLKQIRKYPIINGTGIEQYPNLKIPTLEEYLQICNQYKCTPVIEVKTPITTQGINRLYHTISSSAKAPVVISFSTSVLLQLRKYDSSLSLQKISSTWSQSLLNTCKKYKLDLSLSKAVFTKQNISIIHQAKQKVAVWLAEDQKEVQLFNSMGADYITCNSFYTY